jgi:hypothetical protein
MTKIFFTDESLVFLYMHTIKCKVCGTINPAIRMNCRDCESDLARPSEQGPYDGTTLGLPIRLFTAAWFGGAAVIPILFSVAVLFNFGLLLLGIVPISAAALFGFTFGAKIVDRSTGQSGKSAAYRGATVALFAFVAYLILAYVFLGGLAGTITITAFLYFAGIAFIFVGWLVLVIGALAGFTLYKLSYTPDFKRWSAKKPRVSRKRYRVMLGVALSIFFFVAVAPISGLFLVLGKDRARIRYEGEISRVVNQGKTEELREILSEPGFDQDLIKRSGNRLLAGATISRHVEIIRILLEHGADPNRFDSSALSPLSHAAGENDVVIMNALMKGGADVNLGSTEERVTPLMYAAQKNHFEAVQFMLDNGAAINLRDRDGVTALGRAIERRRKSERLNPDGTLQFPEFIERLDEMIKLLKAHGATE